MRIAHLALTAVPSQIGGLQIVVDSLIRAQRAAGHEVSLVTRWRPAVDARKAGLGYPVLALPPNMALPGAPFENVGPRWPVSAAIRWHQWRQRFDLWHVHWLYPAGWFAAPALAASDTPMVLTAHGADLQVDEATGYGFRRFARHDARLRALAPGLRAVTAISPAIEQSLLDLGLPLDRVHRIGNGVDAARLATMRDRRKAVRERLGLAPGTSVILTVSRNQPSKGLDAIPAVLALLREQGRDVTWLVVGPGSGDLAGAFAEFGVADRVRLLPAIHPLPGPDMRFPPDALAEIYGAADCFAFPSLTEGSPLVAIEAMAAGVPVVGNDVQGIRDAIVHEVDGLLCAPRDAGAMAAAIGRVLDDGALAVRLGKAGQAKARAHDWQAVSGQYLALYSSLVSGGRGAG